MATSILLAGEQGAIKQAGREAAAQIFLEAYGAQMVHLACLPVLEAARFQVHRLAATAPISRILWQAERSTPMHSRDHLTEMSGKERVFRSDPPLLRRLHGTERTSVLGSLERYRKSLAPERRHFLAQFQARDAAFKVVGTGSVGMRDFCVYLEGNGPDDPLFLQIKEETASAYAPYLPQSMAFQANEGERVADGQRAMQLESDPLLGWTRFGGRDYLVRQLNDHKASLDVTTLDPAGLGQYAQVCGELLARGHARSGEAQQIAGYLGRGKRFRKAMLEFATAYAEQTTADWKTLVIHTKKRS